MLATVTSILAATEGYYNLLWIIAVALVLYGLYLIFVKKAIGLGIFCVIVGLLIGPGGVSILS